MSLVLFEGAAGTGKTTRLIAEGRLYLDAHPLLEGQRVLALTKYHGSRKRMAQKLSGRQGLGVAVDCTTIDSFAWHLVRRWRTLARQYGEVPTDGDFGAVAALAGTLLQQELVSAWVGRRYPMVVVDEMQDCQDGELAVLRGLTRYAHMLTAADTFQDLSGAEGNEAVSWAQSVGDVVALERVHRTDVEGLLEAARALRSRQMVPTTLRPGFEVRAVRAAPIGGSLVSWTIKSWYRFGETAIISPVRPDRSRFVRTVVDWVGSKQAKTSRSPATAGPYSICWEADDRSNEADLIAALGLPSDPGAQLGCQELADAALQVGALDLRDWLDKQRRVGGRASISVFEVVGQIGRIVRQRRAFGRGRTSGLVALTAHQAKNREFETVIVLWPLEVRSDPEQQRRLLYNAITRAKQRVMVVVDDPRGNRLQGRPFV